MKETKKNSFMKTPSAPGLCRRIGRTLRSATARTALPAFLLLAIAIFHAPFATVKAQGEADNWYFGYGAGIKFERDGNGKLNGTITAKTDGKLSQLEGCATISDADGNLLFYSDGSVVYNRFHQVMKNGTGLRGDNSSSQSAVMVPRPGHPNNYYLFTVPAGHAPAFGMRYSEVDMTGDGGKGEVLTSNKNTHLFNGTSEKIAAVRHANGEDYWMLAHKYSTGEYYAYKVTSAGVQSTAVISAVGAAITNGSDPWIGYLIVSPDGKRVAAAHSYSSYKGVELLDFDNTSGKFYYKGKLDLPGQITYGVAFSPNGNMLYGTVSYNNGKGIYQWNLTAGSISAINASRYTLPGSQDITHGALQLGPDGKIYSAQSGYYWGDPNYLGVIKCPNNVGADCGYKKDAVYLGGKNSAYGLPPFMASFFNTPPKQIKVVSQDQPMPGNPIKFTLTGMGSYQYTQVDWDFGDGKPVQSSNGAVPDRTYQYTNGGYYTVRAIIRGNDCEADQEVTFSFFVGKPHIPAIAPQTICAPGPVTLQAEDIGALEPYQWKVKNTSPILGTGFSLEPSPAASTTYTVSTRVLDIWNRIKNGDFEDNPTPIPVGGYGIKHANPHAAVNVIDPFFGHNMEDVNPGKATGKKLIVDARNKTSQAFWSQSVPNIVADRDYVFSFFHRKLTNATSPSKITVKINHVAVESGITPGDDWEKTEIIWNSGTASGNVTFEMIETTGDGGQNFFALDDIILNKKVEVSQEVKVTVNDVQPGEIESAFSGSNNFIVCQNTGIVGWLNEKIPASLAPGGSFTSWGYLWQETVMGANAPDDDWQTCQPIRTQHAMSPTVPSADTWYRRKVTYTNDGTDCSKESNVLVVMVNDAKGGSIKAKEQTICQNTKAELTNQTDGYTLGAPSYQWQSAPAGTTSWADISGATNKDYTDENVIEDTDYKRITRSVRQDPNGVDVTCEAESNVVTVKVKKIAPPTTVHPVQHDCAPGVMGEADRRFGWLMISGSDIKWYDADRPGGTLIDTALLASNLADGKTYWASQTLNGCESYDRKPVKYVKDVTVSAGSIDYDGSDYGFCFPKGNPVKLKDKTLGSSPAGAVKYLWKIKTTKTDADGNPIWEELGYFGDGVNLHPMAHLEQDGNGNYKYLHTGNEENNIYVRHAYYSLPQGDVCQAISNELPVAVNHVDGGAIKGDQTICISTPLDPFLNVTEGTSITNSGNKPYTWMKRKYDDGAGKWDTWDNESSSNNKDYTFGSLAVGTWQVQREIRSSFGGKICRDTSNFVTVTVKQAKHTEDDGTPSCGVFVQKDVADDVAENKKGIITNNMLAEAGEVLVYSIVVKNDWDRVVNNINIEDIFPSGIVWDSELKAENEIYGWEYSGDGKQVTFKNPITLVNKTNSGTIKLKVRVAENLTDHRLGITNKVTVGNGLPKDFPDNNQTESDTVFIKTNPRLSIHRTETVKNLTKDATGGPDSENKPMVLAKDELEYTITVQNDGDVDLPGVVVTDLLPVGTGSFENLTTDPDINFTSGSPNTWTIGTLKWREARDLKFKVKVKKDLTGVDSIRNTATVADTIFPIAFRKTYPVSSMKVIKTITNMPAPGQKFKINDLINYTITVENTGNLEIKNINITDPNADNPNVGHISSLKVDREDNSQPEDEWKKVFTATHKVTQADVDAGFVANRAHAAGTDANGGPVPADSEAPAGQGGDDCTACDENANPPTDGSTVTAIDPGEAKVEIKKEAVPVGKTDYVANGGVGPDGKIRYRITVTNTGSRTLKDVEVTDINATGSPWKATSLPPYYLDKNDKTKINPAGQWVFFVEHEVTLDDLNEGKVDNTAWAESAEDDLKRKANQVSDKETVKLAQKPELTVTKVEDPVQSSYTMGQTVNYKITVENTGNVTLENIIVTDANADEQALKDGKNIGTLKPGDKQTILASHLVTQADKDAALVKNIAEAKGTTTYGEEVLAKPADVTVQVEQNDQGKGIQMTLTKVLDDREKTDYEVHEDIVYTITVENTGELTLRTIELQDPNAVIGKHPSNIKTLPNATYADLGSGGLDGDILRLAPGGQVVYKATHKVTQADIDRGQVDNWASASAAAPQGNPLKAESKNTTAMPCPACAPAPDPTNATSVLIEQDPAWEVTKKVTSSGTGDGGTYKLNDVVKYLITVTNTGNVTLANIVVTDPNADDPDLKTGKAITAPAPNGGKVTIEASHTVTQADVDAGKVTNLATAVGDSPTGPLPPAASKDPDDNTSVPGTPTEVETEQTYGLKFTKQADRSKTNYAVGDKISYAITVENTGSTTIKNVTVTDMNADSGPLVFGPQDLPPGKVFVPVEHTVTQPDLDRGYVDNLAEFEGEDYTGTTVTDDSEDPDCPTCPNTTVPVKDPAPKMEMEKKVVNKASMPFGLGDPIRYEITVKNSGNVVLTNVEVKDNNADSAPVGKNGEPNPIPVLMPGTQMVFTAEHTVTAADVTTGYVNNLATAEGKDPQGGDVTADSKDPDCPDCPETTIPIGTPNPELELLKAVTGSPNDPKGYVLGEPIIYEITVTNTGNTALENIDVSDNNADAKPVGKNGEANPIPALMPGESAVFTAQHTVVQADVNAGKVLNTATAEGEDPNGNPVSEDSKNPDDPNADPGDPTEVPIPQIHGMKVEKKESSTGPYTFGKVITYEIKVTNTGNTTLTNIVVTDPNATVTGGSPIAVLAPGDDATITAEHTVTQADVDAGKVLNTATAAGEDSNGDPITADSQDPNDPNADPGDPTETAIDQQGGADMTVTKKVTSTGPYELGNEITYDITVRNTGTLTLKDINIEDDNADAPDNKWNIPSLAPQDQPYVITAKHTVTQADVDAGKVKNLASAEGKDPNTKPVTADSKDPDVPGSQPGDPTEVTNIPQLSGMEVTKKITSGAGPYTFGDLITYAITVKNTGNTTLTDIAVKDDNADAPDNKWTVWKLVPNTKADTVITAKHKVTQADVDAGVVKNLASAEGKDPNGDAVTADSKDPDDPNANAGDPTEVTNIPQVLKMEVDKLVVSTPKDANAYQLGEAIKYTITVRNMGNVTLDNVIVTDANADEADLKTGRNIGSLVPLSAGGTAVTVDATHVVTQADVDKGGVQNLAKVAGTANDPGKSPVTADSQDPDDPDANPGDPTEVEIPRTKGLLITKQADRSRTDYNLGDKIPYTITVENTGNTTITNVTVEDKNADQKSWTYAALPPGKEIINATHTVTQADLDRRYVDNLATIAGTDYNGDPITDDSTDPDCPDCPETTVPVTDPKAEMEMTKAVVNKTDMPFKQGDKIRYAITVKNRGNVPLANVEVKDNNADAKPVDKNGGPNPILVLMPGEERVFTAEHTVTAADVTTGYVNNLATAEGKDPQGGDVTADSTDPDCPECPDTTVPIGTPNPDMEVDKAVVGQPADSALGYVMGEQIEYAITVRNTGNVVLKDIKLTDDKADEENGAPWERTVDLLMPGKPSDAFTAYHTITQADVDAGGVLNVALAKGKDPQNGDVTAESTDPNCGTPPCTGTEVEIVPRPGMRVDKVVADREHTYLEGERIAYRITVTNTGNVTLTNVEVRDDNADVAATGLDEAGNSVPNPIPALAPEAYVTFTAEHEVTVADLEAKYVYNLALATATTPNGDEISQDSEDTEAKPRDGYDDLPEDPNCPSCTVIRVGVIPIAAEDDRFPVWTGQGTTTGSVLDNDTFDGLSLSKTRRVTLEPGTPDDPSLMEMNPVDGTIRVRPGLRPGRHAYPYTIRQTDYPRNLAQAVAYIEVVDPKRGLYIPNVFTPNGDGVNDTFEILGLEGHGIERISLLVADRWGRKLYESEDYHNEWDADGIPDGTYFYRIEAHGGTIGTKVFKGWVTVMRKNWK